MGGMDDIEAHRPKVHLRTAAREVILWSSREQNPGFCYRKCTANMESRNGQHPEAPWVRRHTRATGHFTGGV